MWLGIKRSFGNLFHPQGNTKVENVHKFLKKTLTKFLDRSNLELDELLPSTCYCYNIFPGSNGTDSPCFLMFGQDPGEWNMSHLNNRNRYYGTNEGKIVWKNCTNCGSMMPTTSEKYVKEMNTRMFCITTAIPSLKLVN